MIVALLILSSALINPKNVIANVSMPCSSILEPVNTGFVNAKGAALVYKVKLSPSFPRTSISIQANHLPTPSSIGEYDSFEGFVFTQNEISWRFRLYPTPEEGSPTWAGRFDEITADLANSKIEVRFSNSKTGNLGPVVLTGSINSCK
ncbi:hypothetical protein NV379_21375 [Paenibacillus sp. N1-5-1-14]|nr:hypothetical protein [Paenibacillus radicibacter]MCR8645210.1 hypothetical protein [Paenibacillus radicibacter]